MYLIILLHLHQFLKTKLHDILQSSVILVFILLASYFSLIGLSLYKSTDKRTVTQLSAWNTSSSILQNFNPLYLLTMWTMWDIVTSTCIHFELSNSSSVSIVISTLTFRIPTQQVPSAFMSGGQWWNKITEVMQFWGNGSLISLQLYIHHRCMCFCRTVLAVISIEANKNLVLSLSVVYMNLRIFLEQLLDFLQDKIKFSMQHWSRPAKIHERTKDYSVFHRW